MRKYYRLISCLIIIMSVFVVNINAEANDDNVLIEDISIVVTDDSWIFLNYYTVKILIKYKSKKKIKGYVCSYKCGKKIDYLRNIEREKKEFNMKNVFKDNPTQQLDIDDKSKYIPFNDNKLVYSIDKQYELVKNLDSINDNETFIINMEPVFSKNIEKKLENRKIECIMKILSSITDKLNVYIYINGFYKQLRFPLKDITKTYAVGFPDDCNKMVLFKKNLSRE